MKVNNNGETFLWEPLILWRHLGFSPLSHRLNPALVIYILSPETFLRNIIIINLPFVVHELTLSLTFSILFSSTLNWIRTSSIALLTKNLPFLSCKNITPKKDGRPLLWPPIFTVLGFTNKAIELYNTEQKSCMLLLTAEIITSKYTTKHYQTLNISHKQTIFFKYTALHGRDWYSQNQIVAETIIYRY